MSCGESELVAWLSGGALPGSDAVRLGIGDDMAVVAVGGAELLMSSDMLLDGVHFDWAKDDRRAIGHKAIGCGLSDCAAMAVRPVAATVSLAVPARCGLADIQEFYRGLSATADRYDCPIVGGDTTSWSQRFAVDVCVIGAPWDGLGVIKRSGARPGDVLLVTGPLGGSLLGKHLTFEPRVAEARRMSQAWGDRVHAMMDISDGLALDLHRMCAASGVGAELDESLLSGVVSDAARVMARSDEKPPLEHALGDGEDFELLVAVETELADSAVDGVELYRVGRVTEARVTIVGLDGQVRPLEPIGYEHLR